MRLYTSQEVVTRVEGLSSPNALNRWAKFAETTCGYTFPKQTVTYSRTKKAVRAYSEKELEKFQEVASLIPSLGREEALKQVFDAYDWLEKLSRKELTERIEVRYKKREEELQTVIPQLTYRQTALFDRMERLEAKVEEKKRPTFFGGRSRSYRVRCPKQEHPKGEKLHTTKEVGEETVRFFLLDLIYSTTSGENKGSKKTEKSRIQSVRRDN